MTVYCWARPRSFPRLPPAEDRYFDITPDTRVLAHCHWQPERAARPVLLALHGLEGSSSAHYMRGLADKAFAAGFNVVLLNQRNCGGTEALSAGLYHSGLTDDADHVIRELAERDGIRAVVVAGYSLGGNLALKLAGDYGDAPPPALRGVCAVSPVLELSACVRSPGTAAEHHLPVELRARTEGAHAPQGVVHARTLSGSIVSPKSAPFAGSTRSSRRRTSDSAMPRTTTTARARCVSSIGSAYRRSS